MARVFVNAQDWNAGQRWGPELLDLALHYAHELSHNLKKQKHRRHMAPQSLKALKPKLFLPLNPRKRKFFNHHREQSPDFSWPQGPKP